MSLILEGIDIPKEGEWLEVIIKPTKEVIVDTIRYRDNALLNTEYGLAIQIPKEHGRIVDISDVDVEEDVYYQCYRVDAPTILEAEENR